MAAKLVIRCSCGSTSVFVDRALADRSPSGFVLSCAWCGDQLWPASSEVRWVAAALAGGRRAKATPRKASNLGGRKAGA